MPGFMKKLKELGGKALMAKKEDIKQRNPGLRMGMNAFRSWKDKKAQPGMAGAGEPAPKQVGEFSTGIDTKLKTPKVSQLGSLGVRKPSGFQLDAPFK